MLRNHRTHLVTFYALCSREIRKQCPAEVHLLLLDGSAHLQFVEMHQQRSNRRNLPQQRRQQNTTIDYGETGGHLAVGQAV